MVFTGVGYIINWPANQPLRPIYFERYDSERIFKVSISIKFYNNGSNKFDQNNIVTATPTNCSAYRKATKRMFTNLERVKNAYYSDKKPGRFKLIKRHPIV